MLVVNFMEKPISPGDSALLMLILTLITGVCDSVCMDLLLDCSPIATIHSHCLTRLTVDKPTPQKLPANNTHTGVARNNATGSKKMVWIVKEMKGWEESFVMS